MKCLFIHNSVPEYRISFMKTLSQLCSIKFLITEPNLASAIYGTEEKLPSGISVSFLPAKNDILSIKNEILNNHYDLIILPPIDNMFQFLCCLIAIIATNKGSTKIAYWSEGWQKKQLPFLKYCKKTVHKLMKKIIFSQCDLFIASGTKAQEYFISLGVNKAKIRIAYDSSTSPNVESQSLRVLYGLPSDSKIILYLGRLVTRKGCNYLIRAFEQLISQHTNTYLLIGGEGNAKTDLENLVSSLNCSEKVFFIGKINPQERSVYYKDSDVFVLPSYSLGGTIEAWGLTVNESLEQGTPVIATDVVGAAYDLLDGKCGIMVKERNINEMAQAISHFLDIKDREELSEYCKKRYEQFSVENMAMSFYEAFKSVLKNES